AAQVKRRKPAQLVVDQRSDLVERGAVPLPPRAQQVGQVLGPAHTASERWPSRARQAAAGKPRNRSRRPLPRGGEPHVRSIDRGFHAWLRVIERQEPQRRLTIPPRISGAVWW